MAEPKATLANWPSSPHNRWAFHHVRELVPSADIPNDPAKVRIPERSAAPPPDLEAFIRETDTDGLLILHRGRIVLEHYSQWYLLDGAAPLAFGMGIHGQNLFVDRSNGIVIAKFSSQALPLDAARMALTMRVVSDIRKHLARP